MIFVIADDITGAAEIAALGRRRGLSAQVRTTPGLQADADLVALDTDTRSAAREVARDTMTALSVPLRTLPVRWCFKKVDSVLRGNVVAELETLMKVLGKTRTVLAPANPSKGRVIAEGRYYVDGVPLDETEFAHDPEHPARSSLVTDLLSVTGQHPVQVLSHTAYTGQETGLVVAQAGTTADLARWAERLDEHTLAAGGADFFQAILERRPLSARIAPRRTPAPTKGLRLCVCGSRSQASRGAVAQALRLGIPVCLMPAGCYQNNEDLLVRWAADIVTALAADGRAFVAVGRAAGGSGLSALEVRTQTAAVVQRVMVRIPIGELCLEGGATAGAIVRRQGWDALEVLGEYAPGVVRLAVTQSPLQIVTLKPGSYPWPEGLWTPR
jgi:uncharacterized protein YgbK (DUF1537 family)